MSFIGKFWLCGFLDAVVRGMSDVGASTTDLANSINAYKLELPNDNYILPTFNVKELRLYHDEDLIASLLSQLWGVDAGTSTTNNGNSIFIMENSYSRGIETLDTPNIFLYPSILSLLTILIWSCFIIEIFVLQVQVVVSLFNLESLFS